MAALDTVPDGSNVLIDANVFVYGLSNVSLQCRNFLARCSHEQVYGITLFEVVHEATHEFMRAEAKAKGLFTAQEKGSRYFSRHPEDVKRLTDYWTNTQRILALNLVFLPSEEKIVIGAQRARVEAGLLTNDSVIVAAMREYGISNIATNDGGFGAARSSAQPTYNQTFYSHIQLLRYSFSPWRALPQRCPLPLAATNRSSRAAWRSSGPSPSPNFCSTSTSTTATDIFAMSSTTSPAGIIWPGDTSTNRPSFHF